MSLHPSVVVAAAGGILATLFLRQQGRGNAPGTTKKTSHPKVHVLMVELEFASIGDRNDFGRNWSSLAEKVYAREPNCLSYEFCTAVAEDGTDQPTAIIYERYASKEDLDVAHQATLAEHRQAQDREIRYQGAKVASKTTGRFVKKTLRHFVESNIGHMDR